jgi:predicted nucleic acid-binding protein
VTAVGFSEDLALEAARLQSRLLENGATMSPRDLFVAATARSMGDELVVSDADFDTDGLREVMPMTRL